MIREGSVVRIRVRVGLKIGRIGVVVRLFVVDGQQLVRVAWGTGTRRSHLAYLLVSPGEPSGVALGLTKPTYFYGHNDWIGLPANVEVQRGLCPEFLLSTLRKLVDPPG